MKRNQRRRRTAIQVARRLRQQAEADRITGEQLLDAQIRTTTWMRDYLAKAAESIAREIDAQAFKLYAEGDQWPQSPASPKPSA